VKGAENAIETLSIWIQSGLWLSHAVEQLEHPCRASHGGYKDLRTMVRPEGLEPPAYWFEASRSIQLSYGRAPKQYYREQTTSR
jgi:hypothetical protein